MPVRSSMIAAAVAAALLAGCATPPAPTPPLVKEQASVPGSKLKVRSAPYCRTLDRLMSGMRVPSAKDISEAKRMRSMARKICPTEA